MPRSFWYIQRDWLKSGSLNKEDVNMRKMYRIGCLSLIGVSFLLGVIGCYRHKPEDYPHFITEFLKMNDFSVWQAKEGRKQVCLEGETFVPICDINPKGEWIYFRTSDRKNPEVIDFLVSIGDTHYLKHRWIDGRITHPNSGIINTPTAISIVCDADYDADHPKGTPLNDLMVLFFWDNLGYIKGGYVEDFVSSAFLKLDDPRELQRLLASEPEWHLLLKTPPEAWNDQTVTFTLSITMPLGTEVTRQIKIKFPVPILETTV